MPLVTTIRQEAEPGNPWKSMEIHGNHTVTRTCYHLVISFPRTLCQSSAEVERDSGLAKEIVRALSREKKNVACVR